MIDYLQICAMICPVVSQPLVQGSIQAAIHERTTYCNTAVQYFVSAPEAFPSLPWLLLYIIAGQKLDMKLTVRTFDEKAKATPETSCFKPLYVTIMAS